MIIKIKDKKQVYLKKEIMQSIPEFTIEDLVKKPDSDYANFEGENRVFIMFNPISPEMVKLQEGDKFCYKIKIYQIKMRIPEDMNHSQNIQFNCLKVSKTQDRRSTT